MVWHRRTGEQEIVSSTILRNVNSIDIPCQHSRTRSTQTSHNFENLKSLNEKQNKTCKEIYKILYKQPKCYLYIYIYIYIKNTVPGI
jgi:hypothetical protein